MYCAWVAALKCAEASDGMFSNADFHRAGLLFLNQIDRTAVRPDILIASPFISADLPDASHLFDPSAIDHHDDAGSAACDPAGGNHLAIAIVADDANELKNVGNWLDQVIDVALALIWPRRMD